MRKAATFSSTSGLWKAALAAWEMAMREAREKYCGRRCAPAARAALLTVLPATGVGVQTRLWLSFEHCHMRSGGEEGQHNEMQFKLQGCATKQHGLCSFDNACCLQAPIVWSATDAVYATCLLNVIFIIYHPVTRVRVV